MKAFSKILASVIALFAFAVMASSRDMTIPVEKLPAQAQTFLKEYFPDIPVLRVKKDRELSGNTYEVQLQGGTEIDFNGKGEWESVDCIASPVPAALVPTVIASYVKKNFPGQAIVKIERKAKSYEIELGNDMELKFDKTGKLLKIDND